MSRFVQVDRDTAYLLPPSVQEWLPADHLARYAVDVVEALDLSALVRQYAGRGSDAHHPGTLLALLIYGYATGVHASRASERPEGMDIPQELARREQRLARIEEAKAQLAVDRDSRLIVAPGLTQEVNDKQQVVPTLEKLRALPPRTGNSAGAGDR